MHLLIIGSGYVGLVTGVCFAKLGHQVTCLDIDQQKIKHLREGVIPIYEPGLVEMMQEATASGHLTFSDDYASAVGHATVCFIAVPTPSAEDGSCDLRYVRSAARSIATHMKHYLIIVNKSTVPVGAAQTVRRTICEELSKRGVSIEFDIVSNPEFLKEGSAIEDCLKPERIILGIDSARAEKIMREVYAPFFRTKNELLIMDTASAEMTKYAANAMLATRISFMNELSHLCEKLGANINQVRLGMGSDSRIGPHFLHAGVGYGGSCFPKDLRALQSLGDQNEIDTPLLDAVETTNESQKKILGKKIKHYFSTLGGIEGKVIALLGLSFKPHTDDMREAPSLHLINELREGGATVRVYDPIAMKNAQRLLPSCERIQFCQDEYEAARGAHALALITEWPQFRSMDFKQLQSLMHHHAFFDGRNQYKPCEMKERGFVYFGIGVS